MCCKRESNPKANKFVFVVACLLFTGFAGFLFFVAEREGFEPPDPRRSTVFKTAAIDHSAISPYLHLVIFPNLKGLQK